MPAKDAGRRKEWETDEEESQSYSKKAEQTYNESLILAQDERWRRA